MEGEQVIAKFLFQGEVLSNPHTLLYREGEYFGWCDISQSFLGGAYDNHFYKVEDLGNGMSRFVQSDSWTGSQAQSTVGILK